MIGAVGTLPNIFTNIEISYQLLRRLLGVRMDKDKDANKKTKVKKLQEGDILMVNIGSLSTGGRVMAAAQGKIMKFFYFTFKLCL